MGRGRPRTGYAEWREEQWKTRVKDHATGKTRWVAIQPPDTQPSKRLGLDDEGRAKALALLVQEEYAAGGYVPSERDLTVNEYFRRWNSDSVRRRKHPNACVTDAQMFRDYVSDELGAKPLFAVTRDDLMRFSHKLDLETMKPDGAFGAKRARNIFAVVAAMFRDAYSSKNPSLQLLDSNPCDGVAWPDAPTSDPIKQQLFRDEFLALLACPDVPLVRARLYAFAVYTMTRIGEVRVLDAKDVSTVHRYVRITKALDAERGSKVKTGKTKGTKSNRSRTVTMESNLVPLINRALLEMGGVGRFFPDRPKNLAKGNQHARMPVDYIPGTSKACEVFRRDLRAALKWAGIDERPELFDDSLPEESLWIRFHDLRAMGITWRHARGDRPAVIRQECGHENESTNEIYIRPLRDFRAEDVFPPLPPRLFGKPQKRSSDLRPDYAQRAQRKRVSSRDPVPEEGVEVSPVRLGSGWNAAVRADRGPELRPGRDGRKRSGTSADDRAIELLAEAIRQAVEAERWDTVADLSRQIASIRRERSGEPAIRLVRSSASPSRSRASGRR